MANQPEKLKKLHELLKTSRRGQKVPTISYPCEGRLTIWEEIQGDDDVVIHVELDKQNAGNFTYMALTNKFFNNPEKYLRVEQKDNVTAEEVAEAVYRIIENKTDLRVPKPLIV